MLSCKRLKGVHTYEVLAKSLKQYIGFLELKTKLQTQLLIITPYGETAEIVEERSDEERSSCSGGIVDKDTIQSVQLLPILEGDNDKEDVGYFCQNKCVIYHTLLILWRLLMLARL